MAARLFAINPGIGGLLGRASFYTNLIKEKMMTTKTTSTKAAKFKRVSKRSRGATGGKNVRSTARRKSANSQKGPAGKSKMRRMGLKGPGI